MTLLFYWKLDQFYNTFIPNFNCYWYRYTDSVRTCFNTAFTNLQIKRSLHT